MPTDSFILRLAEYDGKAVHRRLGQHSGQVDEVHSRGSAIRGFIDKMSSLVIS